MVDIEPEFDRACAALIGMAIGDALGMPSQTLTRAEIRQRYGTITDFVAPFHDHPVSHGLSSGKVTDDTEQALLLARRLIADHGDFGETAWAQDLLGWEADIRARGLRDLLGPSSKAALERILAGVPATETGKTGTTNGAAMRIAPVGIATPIVPQEILIDRVEKTCRMTHNTGEAIAGAAAVAAVISCGIAGFSFEEALKPAVSAAKAGQQRGYRAGDADLSGRIARAVSLAKTGPSLDDFADEIGTSVKSLESVPAAFGVVCMAHGDPWQAAVLAANIGDDTDTIGAIAGAMAGACSGLNAFDPGKIKVVRGANDLPVEEIARGLLSLRNAAVHADLRGAELAK